MAYKFERFDLKDAYLIHNFVIRDNRGLFTKYFERCIYEDEGIQFSIDETFVSMSSKNVIRGLHFQTYNPQAKLVSVLNGRVFDVLVDLRFDSPTFGKWRGFELSVENALSLYIPRGFAHGFASLENNTIMLYQCDGKYNKETDTGIRFNDPDISVKWPIDEKCAIYSTRDLKLMSLKDYKDNILKM